MLTNDWKGLKLADRVLRMVLNSAAAVGQADILKANTTVESGLEKEPDFAQIERGQDFYKIWKELTLTAQKQAQYCTQCYNDCFQQLCNLENEINACYIKADELTRNYEEAKAKSAALEERIKLLRESINETNQDIAILDQKVKDLEKQKEIYDILRWIPVVGLISEIVAAIDGTREQLQAKKKELNQREQDLRNLNNEWNMFQGKLEEIKRKIYENEVAKSQLEEKRKICQSQRDTASHEMIEWKNRERYYLTVGKEVEHLIELEADVEEFYKLLEDNPPPFRLEL